MDGVHIRPLRPEDTKTILDEWISTYRKSPWAGTLPNNKFREYQSEAIRQLFVRGAVGSAVVNSSDDTHIIAWIVTEVNSKGETVVHYLHVTDLYREKGVAGMLLRAAGFSKENRSPIIYTHRTSYSRKFKGKHIPEIARRKTA